MWRGSWDSIRAVKEALNIPVCVYARDCVRACLCACACVGVHECACLRVLAYERACVCVRAYLPVRVRPCV